MEAIDLACDGGVAVLTLSRPTNRNALNATMRDQLAAAIESLRKDRGVRALVLAGAGGAFCAGGDISNMNANSNDSDHRVRMQETQRMWAAIAAFDRPVMCAVDGAAYGAGFSLALSADLILASDRARFCLSFGRLGLVPDLAAIHTLPRMVGLMRARHLIYSTRELSATEALEWGLVLEVTPPERLMHRALELGRALSNTSSTAFSQTKQMLSRTFEIDRGALLEMEAAAQAACLTSDYLREASARFLRREPALFQWPAAELGPGS